MCVADGHYMGVGATKEKLNNWQRQDKNSSYRKKTQKIRITIDKSDKKQIDTFKYLMRDKQNDAEINKE